MLGSLNVRYAKLVAGFSLFVLAAATLSSCSAVGNSSSGGAVPLSFNPKQRSGQGWLNDTFVGTDHPNMVYDAKYALYMVNLAEEGAASLSSLSNAHLSPGVIQDAQNVATKELKEIKGLKIKDATFIGIRRSEHVTVEAVKNASGKNTSGKHSSSKGRAATSSHVSPTTTTGTPSVHTSKYVVKVCFYSGWSATKNGSYVAAPGYYLSAATMESAGTHSWMLVNANPKSISGPAEC